MTYKTGKFIIAFRGLFRRKSNIDRNFAEIEKRIKHKRSPQSSLIAYIVSKNIYHWEIFNRTREIYDWTIHFAALIFFAVLSYQVFLVGHSPKIEEIETAHVNKAHNHFSRRGEKADFKEESLRKRSLTGSFDAKYLDEILTAISISLNVDFERKGNSIQIY
ncbi:MAG: hypothetical protein PVH88_25940 [Ignavibacteria bacterium]|jgi:hypothetical protein